MLKILIMLTCFISLPILALDNYQWLENIEGKKSMEWVMEKNRITDDKLKPKKLYKELYNQALTVLNNKSRLPAVTQKGKWIYNFWQDEKHPRGIYRKTTIKQFKKSKPKWYTVLDMDEYSLLKGENYDFHGLSCLPPDGNDCLVNLSLGGGDAIVVREFDLKKKKFVKNGFSVPLAKTQVSWIDKNNIYIGTDFGVGSLTKSGYPKIIKKWQRGTALSQAKTVYQADDNSMSVNTRRFSYYDSYIDMINENTSFWSDDKYQIVNDKIIKLDLPNSATTIGTYNNKLVVSLNKDWHNNNEIYVQGEVLLVDIELLRGEGGKIESVIKPDKKTVIEEVDITKHGLLITIMEDVKSKLRRYKQQKNGQWQITDISFPNNGTINISSIDESTGDFFAEYESFITPPSLYYVKSSDLTPELIKQQNESFDGSQFKVIQNFATSVDGTRVPYFVVMNKNTQLDGKNPTHIFSYGGFRNTLSPSYSGSYEALSGAYGKLWLERGGIFVLANIRGGGEYGPAWHEAALLKNRHKSFEDFESVARDLFSKKITSAKHLGIEGRSNGGLLVTATMTRHPELYAAVVCGAPLIDMKRYSKLLAGASWMGEYGDPDNAEMWNYIKTYSPYQNVKEGITYPPIFFYTSTKDDRVHPGHARKMAAKLIDKGNIVDYYENIEGGHHGFSTNEQLAHRLALSYSHLWLNLVEQK